MEWIAENEGKIYYAAPVKGCLYDAIQLAHQVTAAAASHRKSKPMDENLSGDEFLSGFWREDRLLSIVTVVIYFGRGMGWVVKNVLEKLIDPF